MENDQSIKINHKGVFAITSFVIGISMIQSILYTIFNIIQSILHTIFNINVLIDPSTSSYSFGSITPFIGLIFGIIGVRSQFKKYSIIAIILCALPLIFKIISKILLYYLF